VFISYLLLLHSIRKLKGAYKTHGMNSIFFSEHRGKISKMRDSTEIGYEYVNWVEVTQN
jgi:hypothetical protein